MGKRRWYLPARWGDVCALLPVALMGAAGVTKGHVPLMCMLGAY